jgi:hypothetical protein
MNDKCIYHSMINNKGDISMPVVVSEPKNLNDVSFKQRAIDLIAKEQEELEELKRQKKSPFARFYQVNKDNSEYLRSCLKENPKALQVLFFIFDHMDKYNAVVCSYKVFQDALDMGQATVARSIKYLKEHGFLYVYKTGSSNVYVANKDLVWNSWGNNREYCEFPANIVLTASEQEERSKIKDKRITTIEVKD